MRGIMAAIAVEFLRNPNTNPSNATIVFDERGGGMSKKMRRTCEVERAACSKTR